MAESASKAQAGTEVVTTGNLEERMAGSCSFVTNVGTRTNIERWSTWIGPSQFVRFSVSTESNTFNKDELRLLWDGVSHLDEDEFDVKELKDKIGTLLDVDQSGGVTGLDGPTDLVETVVRAETRGVAWALTRLRHVRAIDEFRSAVEELRTTFGLQERRSGFVEEPYPATLLDLELELDPADMALNRKWADGGKRLSPVYRQLKRDLRDTFRLEKTHATSEPVFVNVEFGGNCDIDAPLKLLLDALEKSVVHNDSQVSDLRVAKRPGEYLRVKVFEK